MLASGKSRVKFLLDYSSGLARCLKKMVRDQSYSCIEDYRVSIACGVSRQSEGLCLIHFVMLLKGNAVCREVGFFSFQGRDRLPGKCNRILEYADRYIHPDEWIYEMYAHCGEDCPEDNHPGRVDVILRVHGLGNER
jgi:hypothetical protein